MRQTLVTLMFAIALTMRAQVPNTDWSKMLQGFRYPPGVRAHLTQAQSTAVRAFLREQFRVHRNFFDTGTMAACPTLDCFDVRRLPDAKTTVLLIAQRDKNPGWWLISLEGNRVCNLTPRTRDLPVGIGYVVPHRGHHAGLPDISTTLTLGAPHQDVSYAIFDGRRYHIVESHSFAWCGETPGHPPQDEDWCFADGRQLRTAR